MKKIERYELEPATMTEVVQKLNELIEAYNTLDEDFDTLIHKVAKLEAWQNEAAKDIDNLWWHIKDIRPKLEANTPQEEVTIQDVASPNPSPAAIAAAERALKKAHEEMYPHTSDTSLDKVTRLEVIDENGRNYIRWDASIKLDYQDDGRTLKIFVEEQDNGKRD